MIVTVAILDLFTKTSPFSVKISFSYLIQIQESWLKKEQEQSSSGNSNCGANTTRGNANEEPELISERGLVGPFSKGRASQIAKSELDY